MSEMASRPLEDVTVVLRGAGERTENLCHDLLLQQLASDDQVALIHEQPFSMALQRSFEIGIESARTWTLCIDADVLLRQGALVRHQEFAASLREQAFGCSGFLIDKFYGEKKRRGLHFYRSSLLEKALPFVGQARQKLRPETHVKQMLEDRGHEWGTIHEIFGVHDYHQYYHDIFRKMATRAQKSGQDGDRLIRRAEKMALCDDDYMVATWGLRFGRELTPEDVGLHAGQWRQTAEALLTCHGLREKPDLETGSVAGDHVERIIAENGQFDVTSKPARGQAVRCGVWMLGRAMARAGARLQRSL